MTDVFIGAGHGRRPNGVYDTGTVNRANGAVEHEQVHRVLPHVEAGLARSGVSFHSESWGSAAFDDPNFVGSIAKANELGVDVAVEIHFDWDEAPRGGFGIHFPSSGEGADVADLIGRAYVQRGLRLRHGGVYSDTRGLAFVRRTAMPAVIWECDRIDVYDNETVAAFGESVAEGLCGFLGVSYVPPEAAEVEEDVVADVELDEDGFSDAEVQFLKGFVKAAMQREPEGRPTSLWHVLDLYRVERGYFDEDAP